MTNRPRAIVIGAGVGGLTAAVALHRTGWSVTVLERAATLEPVGAAISLAPNAQRALDVIGLGDPVRERAAWQGDGGLRTPGGRWLSRTNAAAAAERFGGDIVLLHRADLVTLFTDRLPAGAVRTDTAASLADPGDADRPARVTTPGGELEAELVVAADGINSGLRQSIFPDHPGPAYAGFTTWRVVVPALGRAFEPHETWGRGRVWGSQPLADGRVYAYATVVTPAHGRAPAGEKAELERLFGDWHHPIPDIIAAADPDTVLRHDVRHLTEPLPAYHRGRVALLGDAAHAMTPNLGQGGNQAIEDAIVLAHHTGAGTDPADLPAALEHYTADRLPRTMAVVRRSARVGRLINLTHPAAVAVRDTLIAAVHRLGPGFVLRGGDGILDWRPPAGTPDRPCVQP